MLETGEIGDADWDAFLGGNPRGHHEQCSAFARGRAEAGFGTDRIVVLEGGRAVGGAQLSSRAWPIGRLAIARWAPLADGDRPDVLARAAEGLDDLARRRGFASIRVDTFPDQEAARAALEARGFRPSDAWVPAGESLQIPLAGDDDALLARMASKGRYNVRLARRSGVAVTDDGVAGLEPFYDLHLQTAEYQEFPVFPRSYFEELWRVFSPSGRIRVLTARLGGTPVASIIVCVSGRRCYYGWGGMSRDPEHRRRMPNYLLHHSAMAWARSAGCEHYDLAGTSDFKEKLGGEAIRWPRPLRKYYGVWRGARRWAADWSSRRSAPRWAVQKVRNRLSAGIRLPL